MIYYRAKIDFMCGYLPIIENELITEKELNRYTRGKIFRYSKFLQKIEANPKDTYMCFGVRKLTKAYKYKVVE